MDNRYYKYNCPALMNDGRFISSYVRSRTFDQYIRNINNIESAHEYKHFLQKNGDQILNNLKGYLRETNICTIEGQCLPVSESENYTKNYLNNKNKNNNNFLNQINNNKLKTNEDLNSEKTQLLAKEIYQKMVYEQQQNLNN